jgi:methylmalonyl-CoA mutase cobalamin-binding domain/chain
MNTPHPPMRHTGQEAPRAGVVIAERGLDGHGRGAKVIARTPCDAGYETINRLSTEPHDQSTLEPAC